MSKTVNLIELHFIVSNHIIRPIISLFLGLLVCVAVGVADLPVD